MISEFGFFLFLAFTSPALLAWVAPGFYSLAAVIMVMGIAILLAHHGYDDRIDEANDGPGAALGELFFVAATAGLGVGAVARAFMLVFRHWPRRRPR